MGPRQTPALTFRPAPDFPSSRGYFLSSSEWPPPALRADLRWAAATLAASRATDPAAPVPNYDSRAPFAPASPTAITFRPLGQVQVKGRTEPVEIFAVES